MELQPADRRSDSFIIQFSSQALVANSLAPKFPETPNVTFADPSDAQEVV
jgi:hypothetical protein